MLSAIVDGWTLRAAAGPVPDELAEVLAAGIPATVPGVVHTDLLAAGLIPDPYLENNEAVLAWIGLVDWSYSTTFRVGASDARRDLVAEGLDTVATVVLNGTEVARTQNQHRSYRWDVAALLRASDERSGDNELVVTFRSAIEYAREQEQLLGARPHVNHHPFNAIRKSACNFGWDWGPDVVTAGIWKPFGIDTWSGVRLASVRPLAIADGAGRVVRVEIDLEWQPGAASTSISASVAGHSAALDVAPGTPSIMIPIEVPEAELWWPRGHGAQPLYDVSVRAGEESWTGRVGFRTVELDLSADADGSAFTIRVNGEDIYIRGANWIPDDTFFPRITRESLARSIADAVDANMNLLRVWGGGIYETDDFYDLCDELGVLVWQDFMLACAAYSEDEPLWSEFEAEARDAVTRIVKHPSLALFNGGNETIWLRLDMDWPAALGDRSWGSGYYHDLFPRVVAELAPGIPYSDNSPYSFGADRSDEVPYPNDPRFGSSHLWEVWNRQDYATYRDYPSRFVSEFGFQGPPAWSTLVSVVHDEPLDPFGEQMLVHQKAADGNGKLERGLGSHLPQPSSIEDWHWASQLNQARAVEYGIEHFRSLVPLNQGSIVWQLNDCWPVVSWAAVDGHGIRKPLWFALRRVFADRLLTIQPRPDGVVLFAHNDSPDPWRTEVVVRQLGVGASPNGQSLGGEVVHELAVPARGIAEVPVVAGGGLVVATAGSGERAIWYPAEDPQLALDPNPITASAERVDGGYLVTVDATALAKDITLLADRVHAAATVDSALITLLPGERHEFRVTLQHEVDATAFTGPLVLRTANDLFR